MGARRGPFFFLGNPALTGPRALVTGATGFLGGHVSRALRESGWRVRALARTDPGRSPLLRGLELEIARGDLSEGRALEEAASGCSAIIHCAGVLKARTLEDYREVNVGGTQRLVAAAGRSAPGAAFLFISSQAAAGPARQGRPVTPGDPARPVSWYGDSKLGGEQAVRQGWKGPWIVLRPGVIYGPGDRGLLTYFRMAASGWIPVPAPDQRFQIGAASRIALAITRAAGRPDLAGRTEFLCDPEPLSIRELASRIAVLPKRPARLIPLPDLLVRAAGLVETLREAITRESRPFNADKARELLAGEWLCVAGLARELDLPEPADLARGLEDTWSWYREYGWLDL